MLLNPVTLVLTVDLCCSFLPYITSSRLWTHSAIGYSFLYGHVFLACFHFPEGYYSASYSFIEFYMEFGLDLRTPSGESVSTLQAWSYCWSPAPRSISCNPPASFLFLSPRHQYHCKSWHCRCFVLTCS